MGRPGNDVGSRSHTDKLYYDHQIKISYYFYSIKHSQSSNCAIFIVIVGVLIDVTIDRDAFFR